MIWRDFRIMLFNPELDKSQRGSNKNVTNLKVRPFFFLTFFRISEYGSNNNNNKYMGCRDGEFFLFLGLFVNNKKNYLNFLLTKML